MRKMNCVAYISSGDIYENISDREVSVILTVKDDEEETDVSIILNKQDMISLRDFLTDELGKIWYERKRD